MTTLVLAYKKKKEVIEWHDICTQELFVTGLEASTYPWTTQAMLPRNICNLHIEFQN
jgi:arginine repressor